MKSFISLLALVLTANVCAQTTAQWEDPYQKPGAPGYEDWKKSLEAFALKNTESNLDYLGNSAEKGNLAAAHDIAVFYLTGADGYIKKDTVIAIKMLSTFANQGYAPSQYLLGQLYFGGIGIVKNTQTGIDYIKKSANQGYLPAVETLIGCLAYGYGTPRDVKGALELAEKYYNIITNVEVKTTIGTIYKNSADYTKAIKWFENAARNGSWEAYNKLAYLYAEGNGVEKDFKKAHTYISEAKIAAQMSKESSKEVEANLLDSDGEIYMMEDKKDEASAIWNQMKEQYPEYVEKNKYNVENIFVRTMFKKEQDDVKQSIASMDNKKPVAPLIVSDVDEKIPENTITGTPTFAVIIANENYMDVEGVPFAIHDGETFKQYCEKTFGIPQSNIKFVKNATLNNMKRELNWLSQVMDVYQSEANIIFYYAGHGIPDESNGSAYLLPVDGVGNDVTTGYSLDKLYADLSSKSVKSVVVLLDACFSGAKRDGGMLASARGVAIKAKQNAPKGNMVVLSAAQGDETAYPFKEKGHGLFTYYLLKKLQETKGDVTFGELADYVTIEVKKQSIVTNGKMQTPLATPSSNATDWRNWKLR